MEIRLLRYFLTIANAGTISQAARILHVTQPTLSRQLKALEQELETELFSRDKQHLQLTEAGRYLKSRAEEILALTDATTQAFADRQQELFSGHLAIGCVESANSAFVAQKLEEFMTTYPQITFDLYTQTSDAIVDQLDKGLLDLAVLLEPIQTEKYHTWQLPQIECWGLLVSKDSPLARQEAILPEQVTQLPLLISTHPDVQALIATWSKHALNELQIIGNFNLSYNVIPLVAHQVGVAVRIEGAPIDQEQLKFVPFEPALTTCGVLVWRRDREVSAVAHRFIQLFAD